MQTNKSKEGKGIFAFQKQSKKTTSNIGNTQGNAEQFDTPQGTRKDEGEDTSCIPLQELQPSEDAVYKGYRRPHLLDSF